MLYVVIAVLCLALLGVAIWHNHYIRQSRKQNQLLSQLQRKCDEVQQEKEELSEELYKVGTDLSRNKAMLESVQAQIASEQSKMEANLENLRKEKIESLERECQAKCGQLSADYVNERLKLDNKLRLHQEEIDSEILRLDNLVMSTRQQRDVTVKNYQYEIDKFNNLLSSLLEPMKMYEKEKQEKAFYTVQVPQEYRDDIKFLLEEVSKKVEHPDIISKLVWNEYIKPNLDETFKRVGIGDESGIYKLTSLITGKCYVGKSTNLKTRLSNHYKSVVGIKSIADQAVHHAIAEEGVWNWTIEKLCECDKEELNEKEKYYIQFFQAQDFGYNKTVGG